MQSFAQTDPVSPRMEPIAPWWHTVVVLAPLAGATVASYYQHGLIDLHLPGVTPQISRNLTALSVEWSLFLRIWLALRHRGLALGNLIAGRWRGFGDVARDAALVLGFLVIAMPLGAFLLSLLGGNTHHVLAAIVPRSWLQLAL